MFYFSFALNYCHYTMAALPPLPPRLEICHRTAHLFAPLFRSGFWIWRARVLRICASRWERARSATRLEISVRKPLHCVEDDLWPRVLYPECVSFVFDRRYCHGNAGRGSQTCRHIENGAFRSVMWSDKFIQLASYLHCAVQYVAARMVYGVWSSNDLIHVVTSHTYLISTRHDEQSGSRMAAGARTML